LGSECCSQWDYIVTECAFVEGIFPSPKDLSELVGIIVAEVDVFRRERTECSAADVLHHLRVVGDGGHRDLGSNLVRTSSARKLVQKTREGRFLHISATDEHIEFVKDEHDSVIVFVNKPVEFSPFLFGRDAVLRNLNGRSNVVRDFSG
jgi:hypothetical protein